MVTTMPWSQCIVHAWKKKLRLLKVLLQRPPQVLNQPLLPLPNLPQVRNLLPAPSQPLLHLPRVARSKSLNKQWLVSGVASIGQPRLL
jgi:hypothetical protein